MSTPSKAAAKKPARARGSKTWGTLAAAKIRAECNKLSRTERESLLERGMQIAYGTDAQPTKTRRR
jgi:imidazolonepropionase-like amidohydrolase